MALSTGPSVECMVNRHLTADPRTTMRYDRARGSLDRHATYIVAARRLTIEVTFTL
jgi:integrase/recombinase XerD